MRERSELSLGGEFSSGPLGRSDHVDQSSLNLGPSSSLQSTIGVDNETVHHDTSARLGK